MEIAGLTWNIIAMLSNYLKKQRFFCLKNAAGTSYIGCETKKGTSKWWIRV